MDHDPIVLRIRLLNIIVFYAERRSIDQMTIKQGHIFTGAIDTIVGSKKSEIKEATKTATQILKSILTAYNTAYETLPGQGVPKHSGQRSDTGLVYGKIQSGKTRAMMLTTALALENGFKIVVVLTTHNNRLVDQTRDDFIQGLPGVKVYSKSDLKSTNVSLELPHISRMLQRTNGNGIVIVTSKGPQPLKDVISFFEQIDAKEYPALILDDEGDQATLDTNTRKRSLQGAPQEASTTHSLIHHESASSLRNALPAHVFVSVTGTPQSLVLQSMQIRPLFLELLEPGKDYVGGDVFFERPNPSECPYISLIDAEEKFRLLESESLLPEGLKDALCFFIIAATSIGLKKGWDSYKFLCHPSVKQADHAQVARLVGDYIDQIIDALKNEDDATSLPIINRLKNQYDALKKTVSDPGNFAVLTHEASTLLDFRRIQILNAKTSGENIPFDTHYNFLIGGNTVGRGIAIKKLLVTYYVRESKTAQMDTMYQHARMFGYRKDTLDFTRVFLTPKLYDRFYSIHESDEQLRLFIKENGSEKAITYLVQTNFGVGIKPTRSNVLDANHVKTLLPGRQYYPDYPVYLKEEAIPMREKVLKQMTKTFPNYATDGKKGKLISIEEAIALIKPIKTNARNSWNDKQIPNYLRSAAHRSNSQVLLKYRPAHRRNPNQGDHGLSQGVLGDKEWQESKKDETPVLWIFDVGKEVKEKWDGVQFIYPTIVLPNNMIPFVFNRT